MSGIVSDFWYGAIGRSQFNIAWLVLSVAVFGLGFSVGVSTNGPVEYTAELGQVVFASAPLTEEQKFARDLASLRGVNPCESIFFTQFHANLEVDKYEEDWERSVRWDLKTWDRSLNEYSPSSDELLALYNLKILTTELLTACESRVENRHSTSP